MSQSKEPKDLYSNFRGARIEEVIRLEVNEGDGTAEDPFTRVIYWMTKEGRIIGHTDDVERKFRGAA